jgi:hypothetical protein
MEAAEEQAAAPAAADYEPAEASAMEEEDSAAAVEIAAAEEEDAAAAAEVEAYAWPQLRFDLPPRRLYHFADQFRAPCSSAGNFLKGAKWSPDGSSFLTSSDDNSLRMFCLYYAHLSHVPVPSPTLPSRVSQSTNANRPLCSLLCQAGGRVRCCGGGCC